MEPVPDKPIAPLSPIQVLIKDEIHEDIQFDFNDEPSQQSQASTKPQSASDSDSNVSIVLSTVIPINNLSSSLDQPESTSKYNFRNKQKKPTVPCSIPDQSSRESPFFCKACAICLSGKEQFDIHQSGHDNNLRCNLCTMILKNFKNYEKHVAKCKPFECKICGKTIRFRPNFIKHMRIHNPKNVINTSTIDDSHSNKNVLKAERHKYKCATCDKEFTSWEYFKVHQKIHVNDVNLKCDICDRTFSALACLRGHQKVHTGERPFRCNVCGKEFGQSYNLKIHSRLHSGEKPFECKICNRKMNTTASYNAHIKTHKDFKCAICNETFNQKMKYMSHMGMHETGKVLECNICGKKFGRSSNFYNHQRIHLGIRKFKCYICGQGFVKAANLDAHLLIHCDTDEMASTNSCTVVAVEQSPIASTSATQIDMARKSDKDVASTSVSLGTANDDRDKIVEDKSYDRILFGTGDDMSAHESDDNDSVGATNKYKFEPGEFLFDNTQQTFSSYDSMYSL